MSQIKVVCINKDGGNHENPHEAISHFGFLNSIGQRSRCTLAAMVDWLESGNTAYTEDAAGNVAWCYVRESARHHKFVQTAADKLWKNNLLSLTECLV